MRVIHVVPAISEEASGPSYSVVRLCQALIEAGEDLTLAAMDWAPIASKPEYLKVFPIGFGPKRLGRSPEMSDWLMKATADGKVDIVHNHGMWQMNAVYPGWATRGRKTKLVCSPRGTFSAWAMCHGSWIKKIFWPLLQRPALLSTSCFHATAEAEYRDIRRMGFKQPVAIIPNGIDVPEVAPKNSSRTRTLLFLGRIDPKKGIDILLNAWALIMNRFPNWQLVIVGTDTGYGRHAGYLARMKELAERCKLERVEFRGPLYGKDKLTAYRSADLFVLPTHSENFGMTVAEALSAGTPAIVTKGAPWEDLKANSAGWWIEVGVEPLAACLNEAMAQSPEKLAMKGANGRDWMLREFSWKIIGSRMVQTYKWLAAGGQVPPWVRVN